MPQHGPPLPQSRSALLGATPRAKSNPAQIKNYDNRDDRYEIVRLLKHLSPAKRLEFFAWCCSVAVMPGTVNAHPRVASFTVQLADKARSCDEADEMLNADIVGSLAHMWIDFSLDAKACLEKLVLMARGKS